MTSYRELFASEAKPYSPIKPMSASDKARQRIINSILKELDSFLDEFKQHVGELVDIEKTKGQATIIDSNGEHPKEYKADIRTLSFFSEGKKTLLTKIDISLIDANNVGGGTPTFRLQSHPYSNGMTIDYRSGFNIFTGSMAKFISLRERGGNPIEMRFVKSFNDLQPKVLADALNDFVKEIQHRSIDHAVLSQQKIREGITQPPDPA